MPPCPQVLKSRELSGSFATPTIPRRASVQRTVHLLFTSSSIPPCLTMTPSQPVLVEYSALAPQFLLSSLTDASEAGPSRRPEIRPGMLMRLLSDSTSCCGYPARIACLIAMNGGVASPPSVGNFRSEQAATNRAGARRIARQRQKPSPRPGIGSLPT